MKRTDKEGYQTKVTALGKGFGCRTLWVTTITLFLALVLQVNGWVPLPVPLFFILWAVSLLLLLVFLVIKAEELNAQEEEDISRLVTEALEASLLITKKTRDKGEVNDNR